MNTILPMFVLSSLMIMGWQSAQDPDWHQIQPLRSTRVDVERLLGKSSEGYSANYELEEGHLFIEYSSGPCTPERKGGLQVERTKRCGRSDQLLSEAQKAS